MMKISAPSVLRPVLLGIAAVLVVGCAGQKSASAPQPLTEDMTPVEKVDAAMANGYEIKNQNGQKLYCRKDLQTGSHARYVTKCLTQREWDEVSESSNEAIKDMTKRQMPPRGT